MNEEHDEWLEMFSLIQKEFGITKKELNKDKYRPVFKKIEQWGLSLVRLRIHQKEEHENFNEDWLYKGVF